MKKIILIILSLLLIALAATLTARHYSAKGGVSAHAGHDHPADTALGDIDHYTCSMHPWVSAHQPGDCPICKMALKPVTKQDLASGIIMVDAGRRQAIGVKSEAVHARKLERTIRVAGTVAYDQRGLHDVTLRVGGWIGTLQADTVGMAVKAGEPLFTLYSPELVTAQGEYLGALTLDHRDATAATAPGSLLALAQAKLLRLGFGETLIAELARRGTVLDQVPFTAPVDGSVVEKDVVAGSRVEPGMKALRLADLSRVWIEAALYEDDLSAITIGQTMTLTLSYLPGQTIAGTVSFIYPFLDETTRTGRVRVALANPDGKLKPGMYATGELKLPLGEVLAVPDDAVIYAGEKQVVFLDLGDGRLKPAQVVIGARSGGLVEIRSGLKDGDSVVTSGVFLLASESRIKSGMEKW